MLGLAITMEFFHATLAFGLGTISSLFDFAIFSLNKHTIQKDPLEECTLFGIGGIKTRCSG
jgi:hypothetical protein